MLLRHPQPICWREWFWLEQRFVVELVENDAFLANVGEEVLPFLQVGVHLAPGVDDEAHRRFNRRVMDQPIGGLVPVVGELAELAVVDDDQQIKIGPIALHREGLIDPSTLGVGAEQQNLQDPATLLEFSRTILQRILEFLMQNFQNAANLALLAKWHMVEG
jgi:hypothetical protein